VAVVVKDTLPAGGVVAVPNVSHDEVATLVIGRCDATHPDW